MIHRNLIKLWGNQKGVYNNIYIIIGIHRHFVDLVVSDSHKRCQAGLPSQPPKPLIALFNGVLEHLSHRATGRELSLLRWPVPEFVVQDHFSSGYFPPLYWNTPPYFEKIRHFFNRLAMTPSDRGGFPDVNEDGDAEEVWSRHCSHCMMVVGDLVLKRGKYSSMLILSQ